MEVYDLTKGTFQDYLDVSADSVRIYIDSNPDEKKVSEVLLSAVPGWILSVRPLV